MNGRLALIVVSMLSLAGCPPRPAPPIDEPLPRLEHVRSRFRDPGRADPGHKGPITRLRITRFVLPLDADLSRAEALLDTQGIEPPMGRLWRANGLRANLIHRRLLDDLMQLLPLDPNVPQLDQLDQQVINTSQMKTPLDYNLTFKASVPCMLAMPGDEMTSTTLAPGRCRLLLHSAPADDTTLLLSITPHHYTPRVSVIPRPAQESMLDGRLFEELTMQVRIHAHHVLVVGLHQTMRRDNPDWFNADVFEESTPEEKTADAPPIEHAAAPAYSLGRLIFGARRFNKQVQFLVTIVIDSPHR